MYDCFISTGPSTERRPKNISTQRSPVTNKPHCTNQSKTQILLLVSTLRQYELKHLEIRNNLLKKDIELREKVQYYKQMEKEIELLKKQRDLHFKLKKKYDIQRKQLNQRIYELQRINNELTTQLEEHITPKDRYDSCLRELDELKNNIDDKDHIIKQRDLYHYFYDEVHDLVISPQFTAEDLKSSLKLFFSEMNGKINQNKN